MFYIKVDIGPSKLHRIGLFAQENVKKDQKIYSVNGNLDLFLTEKEFSKLSENEQHTIKHYGFFDKRKNAWHLSFDDIRFCNHDPDGNMTLSGTDLIAKRDIKSGEELTEDYAEFETPRKKVTK